MIEISNLYATRQINKGDESLDQDIRIGSHQEVQSMPLQMI